MLYDFCLCMQVHCKEAKLEIVAWMNQNLVDAGYAGMRVTPKSHGELAMKASKGSADTWMRNFYYTFSGERIQE